MIELSLISFFISWFMVGLICVIFAFAIDLRGKEYDENYFNDKLGVTLVVFVCGYLSVILVILAYNNKKKFLQKLIYKIANIGIDTKTEEINI